MIFCLIACASKAQVKQTIRYELEKKNNDDYFTVIPAGKHGVVILRDIDKYDKGDVWQIVLLDTKLEERLNTEISLDSKYVFKAMDAFEEMLYLLFRLGDDERKDYHLIQVNVLDGSIDRYDIENELALDLTKIKSFPDRIILGGYVNNNPTLVGYPFGGNGFEIIPGYFKDQSELVDITENVYGTFNVVTAEHDYTGDYLKIRTMSYDGETLFDRDVPLETGMKVLDAKSSAFMHGNLVVSGTYSLNKSSYADGFYMAILKPGGNKIQYYNFVDLKHFFDYMKPKRAERIRNKMKLRIARDKDPNYTSRMQVHRLEKTDKGYLVTAELFKPDFDRQNTTYYDPFQAYPGNRGFNSRAAQQYRSQPNRLQRIEDADSFDYMEALIFEIDKEGRLLWDNSLPISDTKSNSLEQVTSHVMIGEKVHMIYKAEEELRYQAIVESDTLMREAIPLKLMSEDEKITHTYGGVGKSVYWYDDVFLVWGFHKVVNDVQGGKSRSVLFLNRVEIE